MGIYKNSIQLRELITELLDFRKQEQGHMKIKVSPHNIVNFLYENYLLFLEYASAKQINFNFEKETDELEVWYDQKQMQKVINNLLSNAIKHTEKEDTITLSVKEERNNVIICVKDTGSGIDAKEIDKIFDRFYQIEPTGSTDAGKSGTGIGLALTKGIIELHHGSIRVESELGKGTSFIVTLRLGNEFFTEEQINRNPDCVHQIEISKSEADAFLKTELEENAPIKRIPDAKLLIVEDNESIREMLANIFKPFYQILMAANGEEGWELVRSEMPCIVVSDVVMPKMSGTELCKLIKTDFNTCHIPVVLLTARTAIELNIEGLRIGADDYITKPFGSEELLARIRTALRHSAQIVSAGPRETVYSRDGLTIDFDKRVVNLNGEDIHLTQIEYKLVSLLAQNAGKVMTYESIISKIWGPFADSDNQILRVNMAHIRRKLEENPAEPQYIFTEIGVGYRMREE